MRWGVIGTLALLALAGCVEPTGDSDDESGAVGADDGAEGDEGLAVDTPDVGPATNATPVADPFDAPRTQTPVDWNGSVGPELSEAGASAGFGSSTSLDIDDLDGVPLAANFTLVWNESTPLSHVLFLRVSLVVNESVVWSDDVAERSPMWANFTVDWGFLDGEASDASLRVRVGTSEGGTVTTARQSFRLQGTVDVAEAVMACEEREVGNACELRPRE